MPTTQLDPEQPGTEPQPPEAPLSVVPHGPGGQAVTAPARIRTNRYGALEEHELLHLLDSIEDERARGRFRESIYLSTFVMLALAWVVFYGPRYLWHAPQLISPFEAMKQHELTELRSPVLPHHAVPAPKLDKATLAKLRAMTPKPVPAPAPVPSTPAPPAATQPLPSNPAPNLPQPAVPTPLPHSTAPPVAEAPLPQPTHKPSFAAPGNASDAMRDLLRNSPRSSSGLAGDARSEVPTRGGAMAGGGMQVLSDTQGVDFSQWMSHMYRDVMRNWIPLLPEETEPPLNKRGETYIIITILPDGKIGDMRLEDSTHDVAIDKSAWGALISEGQFEALPREFHGPNLVLRCHFVVN